MMLETYKIGVVLEMGGNAQAGIDRFLAQMEKLDRQVKETGDSFAKVAEAVGRLATAGRDVDALARAMRRLTTSGSSGAADFERMATAAQNMTAASEKLTGVLRENARLADDIARASASASRSSSGGSKSRGGGFGGHDFMLAGIGASMVGAPLVRGGETALERGMEVAHLRTQILADQRVSEAQADAMVQRAYDATQAAPGTRVAGNLSALIDLKQVTGSLEEAEALLPRFARLTALLQVMDRKRGGAGDGAFAAAKAMEIMGGMIDERQVDGRTEREINPELLQRRLDMMARVAVATNGRIAPEDYLAFAKQARVAGMALSDDFIYERLPAIMLGMGGSRAGTALMSMAQVFQGGKLSEKSMEALQSIGLAGAGGIVQDGDKKVVHPEAIYDAKLMQTDPDKWVAAAQARMEAAGIHGTSDQITALMKAAQRSTIAGILADMLKDQPAIEKEAANIRNTRSDSASFFAAKDPAAKLQQLEAAFDKLVTTLGSSVMDDAVKLMDAITSGLNRLSAWAERNPGLSKLLTETAVGLGAIATALGMLSTAIFVFGPALKILRWASGAGVGAEAGAAAATGGGGVGLVSRLATGVGVAGLAGGGILAGIALAHENMVPLTEDQKRRHAPWLMTPNDGFDVEGRPLAAPSKTSDERPVQLRGDLNIDGRKMGEFFGQSLGNVLSAAPRSGSTGADMRVSPYAVTAP